jgi:hypothetical protein
MRSTSAFLLFPAVRAVLLGTSLIAIGCGSTEPKADRTEGVIPDGWGATNPAPQLFTFGIDRSEKHGGQQSAFVSGRQGASVSNFSFGQSIRADNYRGERVRWSGWIRTRDVVGSFDDGGGLWVAIYYPAEGGVGERRVRGEITGFRGNTEWHQMSVVLDVPSSAVGMIMGVYLWGPGHLWVDDFVLEEVGTGVMTTASVVSDSPSGVLASFATRGLVPENLDFEGL